MHRKLNLPQAYNVQVAQLMALEMGAIEALIDAGSSSVSAAALSQKLGFDEQLICESTTAFESPSIQAQARSARYAPPRRERHGRRGRRPRIPRQRRHARREHARAARWHQGRVWEPGLANCAGKQTHTKSYSVELGFPIAGRVPHLLRELRHATPDKARHLAVPFEYTYGKPLFEFLETDAGHKAAFDAWMSGRRRGKSWFDIYPFEERVLGKTPTAVSTDERTFVVDIGGGQGHDIRALAKRHPHVPGRLVLQDLPETMERLDETHMDGVRLMAHDIFTPQPVQGADVYFMRSILHDWRDKDALRILKHTADAMQKGHSRLIIEDLVLPDVGASLWDSAVDVLMYLMPGGMERTEGEWRALLGSAGLRIEGIWRDAASGETVMETVLVD